MEEEQLNKLKVAELQELAKKSGLQEKGRKNELIKRIAEHHLTASEAESSPTKSRRSISVKPASLASESPRKAENVENSEAEETEADSSSDEDEVKHPSKREWMKNPRWVCNYLVLLELVVIFAYADPIPEATSEILSGRGLFPPYTDKLMVLNFYHHLFYWFFFLVAIPITIAVFFNWDENKKSHYSVLTFAVCRYSFYYLFGKKHLFALIFTYLPVELFTVTCAVTVILAFWDRIKNINEN
eukprot:Sdes_comp16166_c0_seq2m5413